MHTHREELLTHTGGNTARHQGSTADPREQTSRHTGNDEHVEETVLECCNTAARGQEWQHNKYKSGLTILSVNILLLSVVGKYDLVAS